MVIFALLCIIRLSCTVIKIITLHAIQNFDFTLSGSRSLRKSLNHAVVGYCNRFVSPRYRTLNKLCSTRYTIHSRHICVKMKLHTLCFGCILFFNEIYGIYRSRVYTFTFHIRIIVNNTSDNNRNAIFKTLQKQLAVFIYLKNLYRIGISLIGYAEFYYFSFSVSRVTHIKRKNSSPNHNRTGIRSHITKRNRLCFYNRTVYGR